MNIGYYLELVGKRMNDAEAQGNHEECIRLAGVAVETIVEWSSKHKKEIK